MVADIQNVVSPVIVGSHSKEEHIRLRDIVVPEYQREFRPEWAKKIAKEFDPRKFTKPEVARRVGGGYVVIDGQHRIAALRELHKDSGEVVVLCDVLEGMTFEQEALTFRSRNADVYKATSLDQLPARFASNDPRACRIRDIVESHRMHIRMQRGKQVRPGEVTMSSAERLLKQHGADDYALLDRTMGVIVQAWGVNEIVPTSTFLGVGSFIALYRDHPKYDERELIKKLRDVSPHKLGRDGEHLRETLNTSLHLAARKLILNLYNHRRQEANRLPDR